MRRIAQDALSVGSWAKTMRIAQYNDKKPEACEQFHLSA